MSVNSCKEKWCSVGSLIETFDRRNIYGLDYPFFGINKDKTFMPTAADTNNLDNTKYKIVEKGDFVFSGMQTGRDVCIRIALYDKEEPILLSPAYTTFRIKDENKILPQYLFIQFNRFEMDRYGWFLSDGSIRSNLDWDRFCDIEIPLPSIEIQEELVATYNGLKSLAEQNEALIEPLNKVCEAFIVNCMKKYNSVKLYDYIELCDERNKNNIYNDKNLKGVTNEGIFEDSRANIMGLNFSNYKIVRKGEFTYNPSRINLGSIALNNDRNYIVSPMYCNFRIKRNKINILLPEFLNIWFRRKEFQRSTLFYATGSVRDTFDFELMCNVIIPLPPQEVQKAIINIYKCLEEAKTIASEARNRLKMLCPALMQKAVNS